MRRKNLDINIELFIDWMDGWMLFNDTSAQFRPFGVLERL